MEDFQVLTNPTPPLFDQGVHIYTTAVKTELPAQHFEWIRHLNFDRGMAQRVHIINRTVGNFFIRLQPHFHEANLTSPAELRRLIESLKTKSAPDKDCILALMLQHISQRYFLPSLTLAICWNISPLPGNPPNLSPSHNPENHHLTPFS